MKRLLPVLTGFVVLFGIQQAQAFDPKDLMRYIYTNKCPSCVLRFANLEKTNVEGAYLRGAGSPVLQAPQTW
ncbi:hypothetical protein OAJ77_03165 [Rhodospirillales bacterium]|nr:hypothetical protein [Rhodospirillales bacterium]